jgi:hypothetical protein
VQEDDEDASTTDDFYEPEAKRKLNGFGEVSHVKRFFSISTLGFGFRVSGFWFGLKQTGSGEVSHVKRGFCSLLCALPIAFCLRIDIVDAVRWRTFQ